MSQCSSCAFRQGCETFFEPFNRLRSEICALGPVTFLCHHSLDWQGHISVVEGIAIDIHGNHERAKVCEGWKQRVRERAATGRFRDQEINKIQRIAAQRALHVINLAIDADGELKDQYYRELRGLLQLLTGKEVEEGTTTLTAGE